MAFTLDTFFGGLDSVQRETLAYVWRKAKEKLIGLCNCITTAQQRKIRKAGTAITFSNEAEVHPVQRINAYRTQGLPVSSLMLHRKALAVARDAGVDLTVFTASRGWAKGFLKRHHLSLRAKTRQGQVTPEDTAAQLEAFNKDVKQRMAEVGIDCVYNADQTPVLFEYLPKQPSTRRVLGAVSG
ncbi:hypothetical protein DVH05_019642 [Phytophthora capsici]|nr:hypothetical protein DVH05_015305 [Phytophthora capsici]KAG1695485.1 hypothetical protein DVH05_019642 [Phytophthora capsici]